MRFANRTVIVTGAASGFGEAIALRFAAEGARVLVADVDETGGKRVVEAIAQAGGSASFAPADVSRSADSIPATSAGSSPSLRKTTLPLCT